MKSTVKWIGIVVLALILSACAGLTREQTNRWLSSLPGEAAIHMSGKWDSGGMATGGWGMENGIGSLAFSR